MRSPSPQIEPLEARIAPASFVWDGSVSSDWFSASNWTPDGVPGTTDTAILDNTSINSTINLVSPVSVAVFHQSAGTLTGPATLTVLTSLDWSGGTMAGTGTTLVAESATLSISGAAIKTLNHRTLTNEGSAAWSAGPMEFSNDATFFNRGSFLAQSDSSILNLGGGQNSFRNEAGGTFTNSTGATTVEVIFQNAGTLNVQSGVLNFAGAFDQSAGSTRVAGDLTTSTTLNFNGGVLTGGGTVTGNVSNTGAIVRPGDNGPDILNITGSYTQGSGGTLSVELGGITPGTQYDQLSVSGTASLGGTLVVRLINNFSPDTGNLFNVIVAGTRGGTFSTISGEGLLAPNYTATQAQLINNVTTYVWDAGAGVDTSWSNPQNWNPDGVPGASDAAVLDTSKTINLTASISVGSFQQTTGALTSPANVTLTVLNEFYWSGGTMSGSGVTNANGGLLMMNGGLLVTLDGRTLNLPAGQTATLTGGAVPELANGARFNNAGTFLAQNDGDIRNGGGTASLFNNTGTFTRDTTSGSFEMGIPLANSGTINVQSGTLSLNAGQSGPTTGDFNVASGAVLNFTSSFTLAAGSDLAGAGMVDFSSGTVTIGGTLAIATVMISGGTANFTTSDTLNLTTLNLSSGTLTGANTINVLGLITWSGGTMSGSGVTNANGGLLMMNGGFFVTLDGRTLNLPAGQTATLSGGAVPDLANGARFNNAGTFLAQNDGDIRNGGGAASLFNNTGTFTRDTTTGIFEIGVPLANSGTLNVQSGTLSLNAGQSGPTTGDFNVASGAVLNFMSSFTLAAGADVAGAGMVDFSSATVAIGGTFAIPTVMVSGGTANFNAPTSAMQTLTITSGTANFATSDTINLTTLNLSSGTFTGANTINVSGLITWSGGTMSGSGVTNANGGLLMMNGGLLVTLDGRTLNLPAGQTATLTGGAVPELANGARFNNAGTFLAQNDGDIRNGGGAASLFNNTGTFTRDTTSGSFEIGVPLANSGTLNVQSGTLSLNAGQSGPTTGDFNVASGAVLNFMSSFTLAAGADVAGAGMVDFSSATVAIGGTFAIPTVMVSGGTANFNALTSGMQTLTISSGTANFATSDTINLTTLNLSAGTLTGTNTINASGLITWSGGTMSGTGATNANGGLLIDGFAVLNGRTLNLAAGQTATLSGSGGLLALQNGAHFNNAGTFLAQNDNDIRNNGGAASLFNNTGTFTRDTTSGIFDIGIPFANSGTVNVQTGTFSLAAGESGPTTGDFNVASGAVLNFTSSFTLAAGADVAGAGMVDFSSATVAIGGTFAIPTVMVSGGTANFNALTSGMQTLTISSGTANFATSDTINLTTLNLSAGTLTGTNTINASGLITWSGGTMSGTGATNANGGLLIDGFAVLNGRTLNLAAGQTATLSGSGGLLALQNGAHFNNAGTFLAQNDNDIRNNGGAASLFNNSGTFTRATTSGIFEIGIPLANSGTINVQTGTLTFQGGFTQASSGAILGGRPVNFTGGTVTASGTITAIVSNSGANFSPGESGAGQLTINGSFSQTGGTFRAELGGTAPGQFDQLIVNGTAVLGGTLNVTLLGGFNAPSGQQFNVLSDNAQTGSFSAPTGAPGFTATYQATGLILGKASVSYVWDAGAGADTSWFNPQNWNPDGLPGAGDSASLNSAATISFPSAASVATFSQSNGIFIGAGALTAATFNWSGGTQAGSGTTIILGGGAFNLSGVATKILTQRTLDQAGTGVWTGTGTFQIANGAVFNNSGSFQMQNNARLEVSVGGTEPRLVNTGTIQKTGGTGTTTFSDVRLENSGSLLLSSGALALTGAAASFTQSSGMTTLAGGSLSAVPVLNFNGGSLIGIGTLSGNVINNGATVQPGGADAAGRLSINGAYTQAGGGTLNIEIGGTAAGTQYDQLAVSGTGTLGGNLAASLINGFTPGASDVFDVVTAAIRTGTFSTVSGAGQLTANYALTGAQLVRGVVVPALSVDDASVFEGDAGTVLASFVIRLSAQSTQTVMVQYATSKGTAEAATDYTAVGLTTLTFAPGETTKTVFVTINGDTEFEPDETFLVNLSNPANATIADGQGQGTIFDDDFGITANGSTAVLADLDGDKVTITTSTGKLNAGDFVLAADGTLQRIDLAGDARFRGADLTITAEARAGGDGRVDVGILDATGVDLGKVIIDGALGQIMVGDGNPTKAALKKLMVGSLGTSESVAEPLVTEINGALGKLIVAGNVQHAAVEVHGKLGTVTIGGDLLGEGGAGAALLASLAQFGRIAALGAAGSGGVPEGVSANSIGTFTLNGNMSGAAVGADSNIGSVNVGGNVSAGAVAAGGTIASVQVSGDVASGSVIAAARIPIVKVLRNLASDDPNNPVIVAALGRVGGQPADAVGIDKLIVRGDVENAQILLGYKSARDPDTGDRTQLPKNPDASAGSVIVRGDWSASSLVAGVLDATGDGFGQNDTLIAGKNNRDLVARIASVVIKGSATGSVIDGDHFGISAQSIGKLSINGANIALQKNKKDDLLLDETNGDFRVVEVGQ